MSRRFLVTIKIRYFWRQKVFANRTENFLRPARIFHHPRKPLDPMRPEMSLNLFGAFLVDPIRRIVSFFFSFDVAHFFRVVVVERLFRKSDIWVKFLMFVGSLMVAKVRHLRTEVFVAVGTVGSLRGLIYQHFTLSKML